MARIIEITFTSVPVFGNYIKLIAYKPAGNGEFEETFIPTRIGANQCEIKANVVVQAQHYMQCFISDFGANFDLANFNISCVNNKVKIECKEFGIYDYWVDFVIDGSFATYILLDSAVVVEEIIASDIINKSVNNDDPYRFQIWFKNDNVLEEIAVPFGFDAFSHGVERKKDGWALDVYLFAENTELLFTNSAFTESTMFEDIDGTVMFNIDHALKRLIDCYNEYGADAEIELRILFEGELLTKCDFDLEDIDSDLLSYFKCSFIENNMRSIHKINENDIVVDVYSNKDLKGNDIDVLIPSKVLLLSKPSLATSKWIKTDIPYIGYGAPNNVTNLVPAGAYDYFNFCKNPIVYGIDDTLESIEGKTLGSYLYEIYPKEKKPFQNVLQIIR
jgi:hypothetical protein